MSITIEVPADEMAMVKEVTKLDDDGEAVLRAVREYVRLTKLRELLDAAGTFEMDDHWREMDKAELAERASLPQM